MNRRTYRLCMRCLPTCLKLSSSHRDPCHGLCPIGGLPKPLPMGPPIGPPIGPPMGPPIGPPTGPLIGPPRPLIGGPTGPIGPSGS